MAESPNYSGLGAKSKSNILLVDDRDSNLVALRTVLSEFSESLIEARSGEEALKHILSYDFCVVLLDMSMPGMDGFETARAIRGSKRSKYLPIIFITAWDVDRSQLDEGYKLGAVDFLLKPINPLAVQAKVRAFVDLYHERQQANREAKQLRLLINSTSEYAIFMLDSDGRIASWNTGAENLKGYKADEIIGEHFSKFYAQEAIDQDWPAHELRVARAEGRFEDEGWRVRKDGSLFWANVVITALHDDLGTFVGFSKITRDLTERKAAEENARHLLEEASARKLAEEKSRIIHEQRERLRITLESIGDAIISTDSFGKVDYLNPTAEKLVGWKQDEAFGHNLTDVFQIFNEATRRPVENPALRAMKDGEVVGLENHTILVAKNDKEYPIDDSAAPIRDSQGNIAGSVLVFRDVSEKKHNQNMLRESESRFRALMEQAPISIQVLSPSGQTLRVNNAWEELWGLKLEQLAGYDVLSDKQLEAKGVLPYLRRAFAGESVLIPEIEYDPNVTITTQSRHKFAKRWVSAVAYPLKDSDGKIIEVVLIHSDVTARHEAEQALILAHQELELRVVERTAELASANEFMNALLENVQTGIIACDADGVLTLFNSVTRELHDGKDEYISAELWPQHYSLYHTDGITLMRMEDVPLYRALQGEHIQDVEMLIDPAGPNPRIVTTSGRAFYDNHGGKLGAVASMQDVTVRKQNEAAVRYAQEELERRVEERTNQLARANEALTENDKRKDEFLATLAHELRNPLAPISNALQILKLTDVGTESWQQTREMMERQLNHLLRLVDDLLDVSRVMRGKIELKKEVVDLSVVVGRAVEMSRPFIDSQEHELLVSISEEPTLVLADPVRLSQIVSNLLINAAKYTEAKGTIWLSSETLDNWCVLKVRDTGIGISPDLLPHVFELFVQADNATTKAQGGLGIGLTLVKNLVDIHGGTVEAHSIGLGLGSEFVVKLPLMTSEVHPPSRAPTEPTCHLPLNSNTLRLLVVDDNRDAAVSLAMLLRLMGYEVKVAHSGPEALKGVVAQRPNVILLDIGMPDMDGYEVAMRIRLIPGFEDVVLIALTGWGQQEDRQRTARAGFDHHLVKPVDQKELMQVLSNLPKSS